jgi:protein-L-isoaspartate O-methyltransferase
VPRTGVDRAPDAVFVPTPHDVVERMLKEAGVKKTDVVVDLGSGDGRYVIAAAKKFGCRAIGYEIDERLVEQSRESLAKENLGALASIEHKDIFTLDLSGADVVTVFLYPRLMERLIPQLDKLKPGSRILSHQFEMPGVKPDKTWIVESKEDGDKHRIFLWTTPLKKNPAP